MPRVLHVLEIDPVLLVLHKVEVPREDSGLFDVVGDACREFFDGVDSLSLYWSPPEWRYVLIT